MFDRFLNGILWLVVMALITSTAGASLILSYRGLLHLCTGHLDWGAAIIGVGLLLGSASYLLCRHGNDLMDR